MGYVEQNLMPEENIIITGQIHWFVFVPGAIFFLMGINFALQGVTFLAVILIFIALYRLIRAVILYTTTELVVTSKRVIAKFGLIRRDTVELNHKKVESLNVSQGMFGRIFGYGTIVINGTGGIQTPVPSIVDPLEFRKKMTEQIAKDQA